MSHPSLAPNFWKRLLSRPQSSRKSELSRKALLEVELLEKRELLASGSLLKPVFQLPPALLDSTTNLRATSFAFVDLVGSTNPLATVSLRGKIVKADKLGRFTFSDIALQPGDNTLKAVAKLAKKQASYTTVITRGDPPEGTKVLAEQGRFLTEDTATVDLGTAEGSRVLQFDVQAFWNRTNKAVSGDVFTVSLLDPADPNKTLLSSGPTGNPLFSARESGSDFLPGLVQFDGRTVQIDVTQVMGHATGLLRFQLISADTDNHSEVHVGAVQNVLSPAESIGTALSSKVYADIGSTVSFRGYKAFPQVRVLVTNVRFDDATNQYSADIQLRNDGVAPISKNTVVRLPGLPAGVTVLTSSGKAGSVPYLNFANAIPSGGLGLGQLSSPIRIVVNNPNRLRFSLQPGVVGILNRAPKLPAIVPQSVFVGSHLEIGLNGTDPDGDKLTYRLENKAMPSGMLRADGTLVITPAPGDEGVYDFRVIATDGTRETSALVRLMVPVDPIKTTRVSGTVTDVDGNALAGMRVEVGSVNGLTMSDGSFTLDLGTGTPPADILKIRGESFIGQNYPFIAEKFPLLMDHDLYLGANNVITRPIFLPPLIEGQTVNPDADTLIDSLDPKLSGASVMVKAHTLYTQKDGPPFTGKLSITEVPADLTPAVLPANLRPDLVVTIQPGEMSFSTSAPLTLPNKSGYVPGTLMDLWSINPSTGQFDKVGQGKVSDDGLLIETISGGVQSSSWHAFVASAPAPQVEIDTHDCNCCPALEPSNSEVNLLSGAITETYVAGTYQSLGNTNGVAFIYNSLQADVRPIVHFSTNITSTFLPIAPLEQYLTAKLSVSRGGFLVQAPGVEPGYRGLSGGQSFWTIPIGPESNGQFVSGALQVDLTGMPSGQYEYTLEVGILSSRNGGDFFGSTSIATGTLSIVNLSASVFGSGWNIAGLQQLIENDDGSVLLIDGSGANLVFKRAIGGGFIAPDGDFSTLEQLPGGSYRRTLKDQTVYSFNSQHRLVSVRDRNDNTTTYQYSGERLSKIIDPVNLETQFLYDNKGMLSAITGPDGRITKVTHDSAGNLTSFEDPEGGKTSWTYDGRHHAVHMTDALGRQGGDTYDASGRAIAATFLDGQSVQFSPVMIQGLDTTGGNTHPSGAIPAGQTSQGRTATYIDANGNAKLVTLDSMGQILSSSDGVGRLMSVTRNEQNLIEDQFDARGNLTHYTYDDRGNVLTIEDRISSGPGEKVYWISRRDGDWNDPANWSTGAVPSPGDDVIIKVFNANVTVTVRGGAFTVHNLQCDENFVIERGSTFTVTGESLVKGTFSVAATVIVDGPTAQLTALGQSTIDLANFTAVRGGSIDLPGATSYAGDGSVLFGGDNRWYVDGAGSRLNLPELTTLTGTAFNHVFSIEAHGGGEVILTKLQEIHGTTSIAVDSGGNIITPALTSVDGLRMTWDGTGTLNSAQIQSITNSSITINGPGFLADFSKVEDLSGSTITLRSGGRIDLSKAQYIDAASFDVGDGVSLNLPMVTSYAGNGGGAISGGNSALIADGTGSQLNLPLVTTLTGAGPFHTVTIGARSGGQVNLGQLQEIPAGGVIFQTAGGGQISMSASLTISPSTAFQGDGTVAAALVNQGTANLGAPAGRLTVVGNYTQTGTLNIDIGGLTPATDFDQLQVSGAAALDGTLNINLINGFQPVVGDRFPFLMFGSRSGNFATINGLSTGDGVVFGVQAAAGELALVVTTSPYTRSAAQPLNLVVADPAVESSATAATASSTSTTSPPVGSSVQAATVPTPIPYRTFTYDSEFSQVTSITDQLGHQTLFDINPANGNVRSMTQVVGAVGGDDDLVTHYTYAAHGLIDTITDPLGRMTDYDYDPYGRLTRIVYAKDTPDQAATRYEYRPNDFSGNVRAVIVEMPGDPNGRRTEYDYDKMNRVTKITEADPDGPGPLSPLTSPVTIYGYDKAGNLTSIKDAKENITTYEYDGLHRLTKTIMPDPDGAGPLDAPVYQYQYDKAGNLVLTIDPLGHQTQNKYDARNRRIETIDPDGGSTQFAYDLDNNLTSVTDPGRTPTSAADPSRNTTRFAYDPRNRLRLETDPLGKSTFYVYDGADNLIQKTDRNNRVTNYVYDDVNRLTTETWVGAVPANVIQYGYDKAGNLTSLADAFSSLAYTYDNLDRVKTVDNLGTPAAPHVALAYVYDKAGNVTSVTDTINGQPGAVTGYDYDNLNRLMTLTQTGPDLADKRVAFTYNSLGQFDTIKRFAGSQFVVGSTYHYDNMNRLDTLTHVNGSQQKLAFYEYTFDAASRITSIKDIDGTTKYTYDERDQLKTADHPASQNDEDYTFDANGNRTLATGSAYQTGPGNRLQSDGTYTYEYDNEGNMITRTRIAGTETDGSTTREFTWDYRNRLVAVIDKDPGDVKTQEVRFSYDALDRRISKAVDTSPTDAVDAVFTHFVYDREDVILDFVDQDGSGSQPPVLAERYLQGPGIDLVLAQDNGAGSVQWDLADHLGTIHDLIGNNGLLANHFQYDSFGNLASEKGMTPSRYLFAGRESDSETGDYYNRKRYYDTGTGRFLSEDPLRIKGDFINLYRYVYNKPIMLTDPFGLESAVGGGVSVTGGLGLAGQIGTFVVISNCKVYTYVTIGFGGGPGGGVSVNENFVATNNIEGLSGWGVSGSAGFAALIFGLNAEVSYSPSSGAVAGGGGYSQGVAVGATGLVTYTFLWKVREAPNCHSPQDDCSR